MLFVLLGLLVVGALVAPVVLTVGSGAPRCEPTLRFEGRVYHRVPAPAGAPLQRLAIGLGVLSGCAQATDPLADDSVCFAPGGM